METKREPVSPAGAAALSAASPAASGPRRTRGATGTAGAKMAAQRVHRRLDLTPAEWQRLETLAEETSSRPRSGVNAHQPDWRALIKRIASGDVLVNEATPNSHIARVDEALAKLKDAEQEPKPRTYRQLSILEAA